MRTFLAKKSVRQVSESITFLVWVISLYLSIAIVSDWPLRFEFPAGGTPISFTASVLICMLSFSVWLITARRLEERVQRLEKMLPRRENAHESDIKEIKVQIQGRIESVKVTEPKEVDII